MRIAYVTAGAAGMYCGTCLHDNTLAGALQRQGHEVSLIPTYTPIRTDEQNHAGKRIFFGALNVYFQQKLALFRHTPRLLDRIFDSPRLLNFIGKLGASSTDAKMLGELTLSMLQGEKGKQAKELDKLADFLAEIVQPEVVHLSSTLFAGFARRLRQKLGVPVLCSLQGEDLFFDDLIEPWKSKILLELAERVKDVDLFTSPCDFYTRLMSNRFGVPRDKVVKACLGIDAEDFRGLEKKEKPPGAPLTIGYLARRAPEKGLHHLVEAFIQLAKPRPAGGVRLAVAGFLAVKDQAYFATQQQKIRDAGLESQVDWIGEVDRQGKLDFLAGCDVLSVPTVYQEPKGLFVAEALAAGVPVVLPDHGGFPEWIEATGGGLLCRPEDPAELAAVLNRLLDAPEERRRLGHQGRAAIFESFTGEPMAAEMLAIYRQALQATE
jgi:glycosyltransferase involved in cell wall biosynthesis